MFDNYGSRMTLWQSLQKRMVVPTITVGQHKCDVFQPQDGNDTVDGGAGDDNVDPN